MKKFLHKNVKLFYTILLILIISIGVSLRLFIFDKTGGDYITYKDAVNTFFQGQNPYVQTIHSFETNTGEHGYAYLPTLLYIQYSIWILDNLTGIIIPTVILWKIPVLLADFFILYFILKKFKQPKTNHELLFYTASATFWTLNPYLIARYDYSLYDPLFLAALLVAIDKVEHKSFFSGIFYALAVSLKTIPLILLPMFLIKTPKKVRFIIAGILVLILISLPFTSTYQDFYTYLQGSLFVHSQRELQGRPFLSFITYYVQNYGLGFSQYKLVKLYSTLSLLLAMVVPLVLNYKKKLDNKYSWATLSFLIYLLVTPVLSRTHILWLIPWLLISLYNWSTTDKTSKKFVKASAGLLILWAVLFFYLFSWDKGFDVDTTSPRETIVIKDTKKEWELIRILRPKYYELREFIKK